MVRFVCAAAKENGNITRIRSYTLPEEQQDIPATICDAALATSAATGFFDHATIGTRQFVDGALGANNPVEEVEGEASNIWWPGTGDLKPLVKCFISIGTGKSREREINDNAFKFLRDTLVGIATETEKTERRFLDRWAKQYAEKRVFRFNVDRGLDDVGLAEYEQQGKMQAATEEYLRDERQKSLVRDCVQNLIQKRGMYKQNSLQAKSLCSQYVESPDTTFATTVQVSRGRLLGVLMILTLHRNTIFAY